MSVCICLMLGNLPDSRKVNIISVTTSSSLLRILVISSDTHFLITGRLTFEMLTFLLNSSGHLVLRIARASAPVWSAADMVAESPGSASVPGRASTAPVARTGQEARSG